MSILVRRSFAAFGGSCAPDCTYIFIFYIYIFYFFGGVLNHIEPHHHPMHGAIDNISMMVLSMRK